MQTAEAGRLWRYGASTSAPLSRLTGSAWREQREKAERAIGEAATVLVERLRARERIRAPVIEPDAFYERFLRRMPFAASPDQVQAIHAARDDLQAGHPMHRLVCGDVGFGKTEVALHAAALTAFAGLQVAVVTPITILARQHLETFRRRLQGFDLRIEPLIRAHAQPPEETFRARSETARSTSSSGPTQSWPLGFKTWGWW